MDCIYAMNGVRVERSVATLYCREQEDWGL